MMLWSVVAWAYEPSLPDVSQLGALPVEIDGKKLLEVPGPLVIELWASWCSPCRDALPELDALAQQYKGRVTFVALSVDASPKKATAFLARRTQGALVPAFGGWEAFLALDQPPVPLTYVLDAEHEVVLAEAGYLAGLPEVREAVARVAGP
jgi:thiol-disulfide isomerase/thioredoxin